MTVTRTLIAEAVPAEEASLVMASGRADNDCPPHLQPDIRYTIQCEYTIPIWTTVGLISPATISLRVRFLRPPAPRVCDLLVVPQSDKQAHKG